MSFTWPWALAMLVGVVAVFGLRWVRAGRTVDRVWYVPRTPRWLLVLHALGLAVLVVAVSRPNAAVSLPRIEGTVVLAFDNSNSMLAADADPTRIEAAQAIAHDLVDEQPGTVNVGVVAFSSGGVVLQPATTRHELVHDTIDRLRPEGGTSLSDGLFVALGAVVGQPIELTAEAIDAGDVTLLDIGYHPGAVVVVFTDGENRAGFDPRDVAELAANSGIRIYTVGLGEPEGTTLDLDGFTVATALDERVLVDVAESSGGGYFPAAEGVELEVIGDAIDLQLTVRGEETEVTALVALAGVAIVVLAAGLSMLWTGRVIP